MEIVPIVASGQKQFDLPDIYALIKNGNAEILAATFQFTKKRAVDFLFSDTIYTVIFK
jgi:hypothetical protein